jgi:hypothetical protein
MGGTEKKAMRHRFSVGALLLGGLPAQVGPSLFAPHASSTVLDVTVPPLNAFAPGTAGPGGILSMSAAKLANNPPGVWTLCLTLRYAGGCAGCGFGPADTLIATYDLNTSPPTLTPTNEAGLINSAGEGAFRIEPSRGLLAVYEDFYVANGVVLVGINLVDRPSVGVPFSNPRRILNVRGIVVSAADPAIGYVNDGTGSRLKLFWFGANYVSVAPPVVGPLRGIWMDDLNTATSATPFAVGAPRLVAVESLPGRAINSPGLIAGPDGDVEGMLVWERDWNSAANPRDNDMFFADDFDPATPNVVAMDTAGTWSNNGTVLGHLLLAAENYAVFPPPTGVPNYQIAREGVATWLIGDVEPIGTSNPVDVRVGAPPGSLAWIFVSSSLLPVPVPAPAGVIGLIGLAGAAALTPGGLVVSADALADYSFTPPPNPVLAGVWPIQGVAATPAGQLALTNTAKIRL